MNRKYTMMNPSIHALDDIMIADWRVVMPTTLVNQYTVVHQREVGYRFRLHQHPYVQGLIQRLLEKGVPGLQAIDTEYEEKGKTRPDSVEIEIDDFIAFTITAGARMALRTDMQVADGAPFDLATDLSFTLADNTETQQASAAAPVNGEAALLRATLIGDPDIFVVPGNQFDVPAGYNRALVQGNTLITLRKATPIVLDDGVKLTLPVGVELALADDSEIILSSHANVRLVKVKRRPKLFADALMNYAPTKLVDRPHAVKDLDFSYGGAYSIYNWELFCHVPLTVAMHLSKNGRYSDAQRWFHYLFDPTDSSDEPTPERFWKVLPFQTTDVKKIEEVLLSLTCDADPDLHNETIKSLNAWAAAPFRPHVIARYRQQAYMYKTVMAYLDNLISWGDSLFRQDTGESIDEALMLYVLAANILGPRPLPVPTKGSVRPQTYHNLREDLGRFGTVTREMEAIVPFLLDPIPNADGGDGSGLATVRSLGRALYFCVPRNDKLLSYWDTVADRLFKIRNSLNIQGVFRQLALFEPPIDPAMLARAAAAGIDVTAVVNGHNQPLPLVRFQILVQKATEIVQEVKALGNALLFAMEKEDGEAMAILRAKHERAVMGMVEHVKYGQLQEAIKAKEGLLQNIELAIQRYTFYERQLGRNLDDIKKTIPLISELDKNILEKMNFAIEEESINLRNIEIDIVKNLDSSGGKIISCYEGQEFIQLKTAQQLQEEGASLNTIAKFLSLIPEFEAEALPMGVGAAIQFGGRAISTQLSIAAEASSTMAGRSAYEANKAAKIGSYARREQEWAFQSNIAAGEITQIFKQIRAAELRQAIAEKELENHRKQMEHAADIEQFLNEEGMEKTGKNTNKALYAWMKREVRGLYSQCFQFAYDTAKKAERALQHELGDSSVTYLQFGYLAGKEGLLAGEKLYLDVKRMEMAYLELNRREYELTKHVSLLQIDPIALLRLRKIGRCTVSLPESLFDMDGPGQYFRRIKSVAVSIPCVGGPYASINCTLSLLKSGIRKTSALRNGGYAREDAEDDRFEDYFGSLQSIVTSSAQSDGGLFETNLRDERYLPFEHFGVMSEWQLELPGNPSKGDPIQFDYDSISDVILHIRYTAREGGALLRQGALNNMKTMIDEAKAAGSVRLFSIRNEFPNEWAKFQAQSPMPSKRFALEVELRDEHYPYWSKGRLKSVVRVDIFGRSSNPTTPTSVKMFDKAGPDPDVLKKDKAMGDLLVGRFDKMSMPPTPVSKIQLFFEDKEFSDLWIAVTWSGS